MYVVKIIFFQFCLLFFCSSISAATLLDNELPAESYRIQVPDNWNGDLVIWNSEHRNQSSKAVSFTGLSAVASLKLKQGFALISASARMDSRALFNLPQNNDNLIAAFVEQIGEPNNIYVAGDAIEERAIKKYTVKEVPVQNRSSCNNLSGVNICNIALELNRAYGKVCANVKDAFVVAENNLTVDDALVKTEIDLAVNACTGILTPKVLRMPDQQARLDEIMNLTGLSPSTLMHHVSYKTVSYKAVQQKFELATRK